MKRIKKLRHLIQIQCALISRGFWSLKTLLQLLIRFRFNPLSRFKKEQHQEKDTLRKAADELKPIFVKVGQTLSEQPEALHALKNAMDKLQNIIHSDTQEKTARESLQDTSELEQTLKTLFSELKSAQFNKDKAIHQINTVLDQGLKFAQQLNEPMQLRETERVDGIDYPCEQSDDMNQNIHVLCPLRWGDFIHEIDELSLNTERLQAQVNQLLSCYEIH